MGYNAFSLPRLNTEGPDIGRALLLAEQVKGTRQTNALRQKALEDTETRRTRESEAWGEERKTKALSYERDLLDYMTRSIGVTGPEEYPEFRKNMIRLGMGERYLPESFNSPEEFEAFREKATSTAGERIAKLNASLKEPKLYETSEAGYQPASKAVGLTKPQTPKEQRLYLTEEGYQTAEGAIGKRKPTDKDGKVLDTRKKEARAAVFKLYNMGEWSSVDDATSTKAADAIERTAEMLNENPEMDASTAAAKAKREVDRHHVSLGSIPKKKKSGLLSKGNDEEAIKSVRDSLVSGVDTGAILEKLIEKGWTAKEGIALIRQAAK